MTAMSGEFLIGFVVGCACMHLIYRIMYDGLLKWYGERLDYWAERAAENFEARMEAEEDDPADWWKR